MIRILIPSCSDDLLRKCFKSMERAEPGSAVQVIVGDNGLSPRFRKDWPEADFVPVPRPFVYSQAINLCAAAAVEGEDLLIMGDDTELLTPAWLTRCEALFDEWPAGYGLLNLCEPSTAATYGRMPWEGDLIEADTVLAFCGTLIPRKRWNQIGSMDVRYTGYGFDDFDYCLRLLHAGFKLGITGAAMIRHKGSGTYVGSAGNQTAVNRAAFSEKWGIEPFDGFPAAAPHLRRKECACAA